ncbi:MAG: hypothetical protein M3N53_06065 [Actinomycetota bacterium]|nr:hypothetical protein [Actinomycetota bacterium]
MANRTFEFWPDYGVHSPLWEKGRNVSLDQLPIADDVRQAIQEWTTNYAEDRLPLEGPGDPDWLAEGQKCLAAIRRSLPDTEVVVTEPWWGEEPKPI